MLLINGPLMINYHKTIKGIKAFGAKPIDVVYGENERKEEINETM